LRTPRPPHPAGISEIPCTKKNGSHILPESPPVSCLKNFKIHQKIFRKIETKARTMNDKTSTPTPIGLESKNTIPLRDADILCHLVDLERRAVDLERMPEAESASDIKKQIREIRKRYNKIRKSNGHVADYIDEVYRKIHAEAFNNLKIKRTLPTPAELAAFAASLKTLGTRTMRHYFDGNVNFILEIWKEWEVKISEHDCETEQVFPKFEKLIQETFVDYDEVKTFLKASDDILREYFFVTSRYNEVDEREMSNEELNDEWIKIKISRMLHISDYIEMKEEKERRASEKGLKGAKVKASKNTRKKSAKK